MLDRKRPEIISTDLTIAGLGEKFTVPVTYKNLTQKEWEALLETQMADGQPIKTSEMLERVVAKFNKTESPKSEDFLAMESEWPGIMLAVVRGFHLARTVNLEKN